MAHVLNNLTMLLCRRTNQRHLQVPRSMVKKGYTCAPKNATKSIVNNGIPAITSNNGTCPTMHVVLQADVLNSPLVIVARTDAEACRLV